MYLRFCVLVEIFHIVDYLPLQMFVVYPSKKEVFRGMLVEKPSKNFSKIVFRKELASAVILRYDSLSSVS